LFIKALKCRLLEGFLSGLKLNCKTMRAAIYARVSTRDQKTLSMQLKIMREYAENRAWSITIEAEETSSAVKNREKRD
jgi:predicted site-specific integrase-resolvase